MNTTSDGAFALVRELSIGGSGPTLVVKDCIDIAGTVTGCGSAAFAETPPAEQNAAVVDTVLAAGCQIIGRANMHELAFGMTGVNGHTGTPVNPHWPDRIPGGSSSGSAVAVAAGLCDFAIGTDTGGSVRQPATCCGVYGFKPTFGRISRAGLVPKDSSLDCVGVLARDINMLIAAMTAMDPSFSPATVAQAPKIAKIVAVADPEVAEPLNCAMMDAYPDIARVTLTLMDAAFDAGMVVMAHEMAAEFGPLLDAGAPLGEDIRKRLTAARLITAAQRAEAEAVRRAFTAEVDALLETYDALAIPSLPVVPPTLEAARDPQAILPLTRFQRPFNLSGHPAIVVPALTPTGLPIGLQLIGRKGEDAKLCAIAAWLVSSCPYFLPKDQDE